MIADTGAGLRVDWVAHYYIFGHHYGLKEETSIIQELDEKMSCYVR